MIDTQQQAYIQLLIEQGTKVYYYEDKPYRILLEGKAKTASLGAKVSLVMEEEELTKEDLDRINREFEKAGIKWMDVVVYEPLYPECDIRVCVKEKEDFYNNYKIKE